MSNRFGWQVVAGCAVLAAALSGPVQADEVADFYKGKRIQIVTGFDAGGGYGIYSQLLGEFMTRHMAGNPEFIPQYMPGAGSLKAGNYVFNAAPKDGLYLAVTAPTLVVQQVTKPAGMKMDHAKVQYVGRMNQMNTVFMVHAGIGINSLDDAKKREVVLASTGKGDQSYMYPMMANRLIGTKFKVIIGYKGSKDMQLAMDRKEVEGRGSAWASWKSSFADQLASKQLIPIYQVGLAKAEDLPNVPLLQDVVKNEDDKVAVDFLSSGAEIGRTMWAAPEVPKDRIAALRKAFDAAMKDPELQATAKKRKMDLEYLAGDKVDAIVGKTLKVTQKQIDRANALIQ